MGLKPGEILPLPSQPAQEKKQKKHHTRKLVPVLMEKLQQVLEELESSYRQLNRELVADASAKEIALNRGNFRDPRDKIIMEEELRSITKKIMQAAEEFAAKSWKLRSELKRLQEGAAPSPARPPRGRTTLHSAPARGGRRHRWARAAVGAFVALAAAALVYRVVVPPLSAELLQLQEENN